MPARRIEVPGQSRFISTPGAAEYLGISETAFRGLVRQEWVRRWMRPSHHAGAGSKSKKRPKALWAWEDVEALAHILGRLALTEGLPVADDDDHDE